MYKPYYFGVTKKFNGIGFILVTDPPYATVRRAWSFEFRLGWLVFWYVKEIKK